MINCAEIDKDAALRWGRVSRRRLYGNREKSSISVVRALQVCAGSSGTGRERRGECGTNETQGVPGVFPVIRRLE